MTDQNLTFLQYPGSILSDQDIHQAIDKGFLVIKPSKNLKIQPSSIDLHLARYALVFTRRRVGAGVIDLKEPVDKFMERVSIDPHNGLVLHPGEFILGVTKEWIKMPPQLSANVDGKSSLGRLGLVVHATAGYIDPGFEGHITLEITNYTELPMRIYADMPFAQIRFATLTSEAEILYGSVKLNSKYKNPYKTDPAPMASQYYKNFKLAKSK